MTREKRLEKAIHKFVVAIEDDVESIVDDVFMKEYQKLDHRVRHLEVAVNKGNLANDKAILKTLKTYIGDII